MQLPPEDGQKRSAANASFSQLYAALAASTKQ
jgi:hypothetical protein